MSKVPPTAPVGTIENIVEHTSSPSVSKITINSEYKYMAFTYTSGAINTPYTKHLMKKRNVIF